MAYRIDPKHKKIKITKTFGNVRVKICSKEAELLEIGLDINSNLEPKPEEEGDFKRLKDYLSRLSNPFNYEDVSRLINVNGYAAELASNVFTLFDSHLTRHSKGEFKLLPELKDVIEEGLKEYANEIRKKAETIFKTDAPITEDHFL